MSVLRYVIFALIGVLGAVCVHLFIGLDSRQPAQPVTQSLQKINLNTAPESILHRLPRISTSSVRAIAEARARSNFKDWNDFVARRVVPQFAEHAIKDMVTF